MDGLEALDISVASPHALGLYHLVAEIGRGGMADVYLALTPPVNGHSSHVVIKQLRADIFDDEDFRAMFFEEARLASKLDHPNVVKTFEVGKDGDSCFIVMEFLDGQPLSRVRRYARKSGAETPLTINLKILGDVLSGLHYVHELADQDGVPLGVVHRDVTPQNVFVTYDGQVKVVDFGIAKARARQVETRVGVVKGKLAYIAPENVRGDPVDRRSDIFSVGVMLWEAATGKRFWQGLDELAIYQKLISGELPTELGRTAMSPHLFAIVERALAPDPGHRFATAAQMRSALEAFPHLSASRDAVSGYIYQLFVEERRKFHQRIQEEIDRVEAGEWPTELPNLRNEGSPLSTTPADRNDIRNAQTARPGNVAPNSVRTNPTVRTSFVSQSTVTQAFTPPGPRRTPLYAGAGVLLIVGIWAFMRFQPRPHAEAPVTAKAAIEVTAAPAPVSEPQPAPSATQVVLAPVEAKHPRSAPALVRPAARKVEAPDFPELARAKRTKRQLDADDPWANK